MNPSDRQLGRLNLILTDATGKSAIEPEDRAIWEMLDATMAQEASNALAHHKIGDENQLDDRRQHMLCCPTDVNPEDWHDLLIDSRFFKADTGGNL
jgi:hypothetical protein